MTRFSRPAAVAALVAAFAACGGPPQSKGSNSGSNANPNSIPNQTPNANPNAATNAGPGEIEQRLWATICDVAFNCPGGAPEILTVAGRFASQSDCQASGDFPGFDFDTAQIEASIADGRASWNEAAAQQCFAAIRETMCNGGGFDDAPECDDVVVGLVGAGGGCASSEECAEGFDCERDSEACHGTCEANCGDAQCSDAEICDFVEEVCRPVGGEGDMCDWDPDCQSGLFCDDSGLCDSGGTVADGGSCGSTIECTRGLVCFQGSCGSITVLDPGASCSYGERITAVCKAGTVCTNLQVDGQRLVGICATAQPQGAACRLTFECQWGLSCDAANPLEVGSCVPARGVGEACTEDMQCESLNCNDGRCFELGPGEVCTLP